MKKVLIATFTIGLTFSLMLNVNLPSLNASNTDLPSKKVADVAKNGDLIYNNIEEGREEPLNPTMEIRDKDGNLVWEGKFDKWKLVRDKITKKLDNEYEEEGLKPPSKPSSEEIKEAKNKKYSGQ